MSNIHLIQNRYNNSICKLTFNAINEPQQAHPIHPPPYENLLLSFSIVINFIVKHIIRIIYGEKFKPVEFKLKYVH